MNREVSSLAGQSILCEHRALLTLIPSLHKCTDHYSVECLWGALCRYLGFPLCSSHPFSTLPYEYWLPASPWTLSSVSSAQGEHQALPQFHPPALWPGYPLKVVTRAIVWFTLFFSNLSGIIALRCLVPRVLKLLFHVFCPVFWLFQAGGQIWSLLLHLGWKQKASLVFDYFWKHFYI